MLLLRDEDECKWQSKDSQIVPASEKKQNQNYGMEVTGKETEQR